MKPPENFCPFCRYTVAILKPLFLAGAISKALGDTYQRLYELPDPKLPVKYPRTPGYRPSAEENPYNAW